MPRSTTVLTALVAFGAGVAVEANWKELSKKVGPLVEKLGLQVADLGDFLSAAGLEEFAEAPVTSRKNKTASRAKAKASRKEKSIFDETKPYLNGRNGHHDGAGPVKVAAKRRPVRSKTPKVASLAAEASLVEAVIQN